jgi:hypothetical protein
VDEAGIIGGPMEYVVGECRVADAGIKGGLIDEVELPKELPNELPIEFLLLFESGFA